MIQNNRPLISIVVCAYNGAHIIQSCLTGLISQSCPSDLYEIIIIDDESMDGTYSAVSDFMRGRDDNAILIRLFRIKHGGLSIARNTGIHLSKGKFIAFIDQDAMPDKNWVVELLKAWSENSNADAIGGRVDIRNACDKTAQFLYLVYYEPIEQHAIIGTNMSFKKERLLQVGGFGDPFTSRGDETFLFDKMGSNRKEVKWPAARVFHDWPISVGQWLKERISNGEMSRLIGNILDGKSVFCRVFLRRRIIIIMLFVTAILGISYKVLWGLFLLPVIFFIRGIRQGSYIRLRRKYSHGLVLLLTIFWEFLDEAGMWLFCLGRWRGDRIPIEHNKAIKGTVSDKYIIANIENR